MTNNLKITNPINFYGWDELIKNFPDYSFFHTSAWAKVIRDSYNYKLYYFILENGGIYKAVFPLMIVKSFLTQNRAVSLPFSDYCGPLISEGIDFQELFYEVLNFCREQNLKYLEIRGGNKYFNNVKASTFDYNHQLDLTIGEESLFKNFSSNTKRNIKKAIREGITIEISNTAMALENFYKMNCVTRKKHGLPPQPKKFFKNLFNNVLSKNKGFISIAKYRDKSIASAVYLLIGRKALYKFGASYMEYQNFRANNLVMWDSIKYCSAEGYESFCFGRTEPDNEGLRKFKLGWGANEQLINTYRYSLKINDFVPMKTMTTGLHNKIFLHTPISMLKIFGTLFYKHIG